MRGLFLDCRGMSKVLSASREEGGRLGLGARLHLLICDACRRVRAHFDVMSRAVKRAPESGPVLSPGAKDRLRRALREG